MKKPALITSGCIFVLFSVAHWVRLFRGDEVIVAGYTVPVSWSAIAGGVSLVLAAWMFLAARDLSSPSWPTSKN